MNQPKIEPDYKQMSEILNEVIGGVKLDSLEPIVNVFMESVESQGYRLHEIIQKIEAYVGVKYNDSNESNQLSLALDKAAKEAQILYESTQRN